MEKKLTISDVFYFVNQAIEKGIKISVDFYDRIENKDFEISSLGHNIIRIENHYGQCVDIEVSDMEQAQFNVLVEKVKEYSRNQLTESFLNYFKEEDTSEKTIDDIDD